MRRIVPCALLACLLLLVSSPALAQRKLALVIGNGAYPTAPLKNPVNDAADMAAALAKLGFEVQLLKNASMQQMENAVREFGQKLRQGGVGLFFFAGHGMQVAGENYLVPVNAVIQSEGDVKYGCLNAGLVLAKMEDAGNGLNVVILDACRNNPFARSFRSAETGLARMDAPTGSLIAYATAPGKVASDGAGRNGLYTEHLLKNIATPGLSVTDLFMNVREGVVRDSAKKQVPWENTSLIGRFSFAGGEQTASLAAPAAPTTPAAKPVDLKAEKQRVAEEAARLRREQQELAQLQALQAEKARLEAQRQKLEQAKQLALAPIPKERPKETPAAATAKQLTPPAGAPGKAWRDPVAGVEFIWVPGGTFEMGCGPWTSNCFDADEKPVHTVRVNGFWLGKFEVTQGQWQRVMGSNPSTFKRGDNYPVEQVSWNDAKDFVARLNGQGTAKFRLPTEAEWEYAARSGGRPERYAGGSDLGSLAWYSGNSGGSPHEVGTKAPNGLGLHDMTGNVGEWCEDSFSYYSSSSQDNPLATGSGTSQYRMVRGCSWSDEPQFLRAAYRGRIQANDRTNAVGLRLVCIP